MEVLYCFKYNRETGELKKFKVADWLDRCDKIRFTLPNDTNYYHVPKRNLDKFLNGKYLTFSADSDEKVVRIVQANILEKLAKAKSDANRYTLMLAKLGESKREENTSLIPTGKPVGMCRGSANE